MSLTIYKASAGSGKTYKMALEVVQILLRNPEAYKHILAVTFTNKAAEELKERIIYVLNLLSKLDDEKQYLSHFLKLSEFSDSAVLQRKAQKALSYILHDYSRFAVSTIDKFFNRIITGFSYEANVRPDSDISLDQEIYKEEALDEMLESFSLNDRLGEWLLEYSKQRINEDKNWDIRNVLLNESKAITKESFLLQEENLRVIATEKNRLKNYKDKLVAIQNFHENAILDIAKEASQKIQQRGFTLKHFSNAEKGPAGILCKQEGADFPEEIGKRIMNTYSSPEEFLRKGDRNNPSLMALVHDLHPLLIKYVDYIQKHSESYFTAQLILKSINDFGVFVDLNQHLQKLCHEKRVYFPFQILQLLHTIIVKANALFVYEKIGTRYQHYMLDEFQDTSIMQWNIIKPLLEESLAVDGNVFIVGDIKQSIYRWRNGDWTLLNHIVEQDLPGAKSDSLDTNYRSAKDIVRFNNHIIRDMIPLLEAHIDGKFGLDDMQLSKIYKDFAQLPHSQNPPFGFVQAEIIRRNDEFSYEEQALEKMSQEMERLFRLGYSPGNMAVLTRSNKAASQVAQYLMDCEAKSEFRFPVVSATSLELAVNPAVKCLLSAMIHVANPEDKLALGQLVFAYRYDVLRDENFYPEIDIEKTKEMNASLMQYLPEKYQSAYTSLSALPLFELVENLILMFGLNAKPEFYAYVTAFQDYTLSYAEHNSSDINGFVDFFEKKSPKLELPDSSDAIVISTVHKSKGLQYRFVFIPFLDWIFEQQGPKDTMWVIPEKSPFNELPVVLVKDENKMEKTIFSHDFKMEYFKKIVDVFNLFYVAITRAEEGLWFYLPSENKSRQGFNIAEVILKALENLTPETNDTNRFLDMEFGKWSENQSCFKYGEILPEKEKSNEKQPMVLTDYSINIRNNTLRYHHPNAFVNLQQDEIIREKTNMGSVAHKLLEYTQRVSDLDQSAQRLIASGRLSRELAHELINTLKYTMKTSPVKDWFDNDFQILNEREILRSDGRILKPDRVIVNQQTATVVDYKFGKIHNEKYAAQVKEYMMALEEMGYHSVRGYLWYVLENKVVELS
jgi:ATP-dependent helicase/nuclease subunit A